MTISFSNKEIQGTCTECIPPTVIGEEYLLDADNNTCEKFDASNNDHCIAGQRTLTTCKECESGNLTDETCYPVDSVTGVASWKISSGDVVPNQCLPDYFKSQDTCEIYSFQNIANCVAKSLDKNECLMCEDNY